MVMKVEVICKETIKPSSPTPLHLHQFQLSFIDQINVPIHMPLILFYSSNGKNENLQRCIKLKKSLAKTLTHFYPVAGRMRDDASINCNDEGIDYIETRVSSHLSEIIGQSPNAKELKELLPCECYNSSWSSLGPDVILAIQVNIFMCGGLGIGVCMSHKIADASSLATFIKVWANIASGSSLEDVNPCFGLTQSLFPPRDLMGFTPKSFLGSNENIVIKRFVFDGLKLEALREKVASGSTVSQPTRVEALSALLWKVFLATLHVKTGFFKAYGAVHAVNLRGRMDPILPEHSFGNIYWHTVAPIKSEFEIESGILVGYLRDSIKQINDDYVRKVLSGDVFLSYAKMTNEKMAKNELGFFNISSWCRFSFYDADFGWGNPNWVCSIGMPVTNLVVLMDTKMGDGIEAWVHLSEEDMRIFECDEELLSFVSST